MRNERSIPKRRSLGTASAGKFATAMLALAPIPMLVAAQAAPHFQVIATGLNNPRGLAFGPRGNLYVAESGHGGNGQCIANPEPNAPPLRCFGTSGAIVRVDIHGGGDPSNSWTRVLADMPSLASQDDNPETTVDETGSRAIGPVDIGFLGRQAFVLMSYGGNLDGRNALGKQGEPFGTILKVRLRGGDEHDRQHHTGDWQIVADIALHEHRKNPDAQFGGAIDSNPNGLQVLPFRFLVADAGGNDVVEAWITGHTRTFAVPPPRCFTLPGGAGNGGCGPGQWSVQSVPTSVTRGPDRAIYIGELTGVPFPVGGARIQRALPWGGPTDVALDGFTNIIDVAFDDEGNAYVLQIASPIPGPQPSGRLIRVSANDPTQRVVLAERLMFPGGIAIGPDRAAYVTNFGALRGLGQVIRVPLP